MKRKLFFEILPRFEHKNAIVICGMRQVGKTTLLKMLYDLAKSNKLWFDFDNPLDQMIFEANELPRSKLRGILKKSQLLSFV
jgi:predicted AAA+ superfamily ATPase